MDRNRRNRQHRVCVMEVRRPDLWRAHYTQPKKGPHPGIPKIEGISSIECDGKARRSIECDGKARRPDLWKSRTIHIYIQPKSHTSEYRKNVPHY